ncbi:MAG: helix-turn-helix domain-containing protein [Prevotella sp.]|nr:helix-turn-helix domain-containing protein [Prevotella sp.]MCI2081093.1 helix-turn-helix domain-containing protein [Prevotella sp.]MCI2102971.1 helix-turn-helix domain-containing protein [Prevotella sp.]
MVEALRSASVQPALEGKEETFYSRKELCQKFHISDTKLWRLEKDGTIHKQKFGRRNLYLRTEVDEIFASGKLATRDRKTPEITKS